MEENQIMITGADGSAGLHGKKVRGCFEWDVVWGFVCGAACACDV